MNLTKCFVAGLCLTAMTVSAVGTIQGDAFENGIYSGSWSGSLSLSYGEGGHVVDGDAFTGIPPYTSARPMTGVTSNRVLRLDTEGGVWTNMVGVPFGAAPVFVDMLVKFVPSEDLPQLDSSVKLAVAVTNGCLVVTKNGSQWNQTNQAIDTNTWYRFSAELKQVTSSNWVVDPFLEGGGYWDISTTKRAIVKINQSVVSVGGENDFIIFDVLGTSTLTSIGFSGTGFVDEIVVRDTDPFALPTVPFGGSGSQVVPAELNAWKIANSITGTENPSSFNAFVMNVAPEANGDSPVLFVNSIAVGGTTTLSVMAKYADGHTVVLGSPLYNGAVLTVWGKAVLETGNWQNIGTTLTGFDQPAYKFFKVTTGTSPNP